MKILPKLLLMTTSLMLAGCGQMGQQWMDPDKTFAAFDQPTVKGVNDTQEDAAKAAITAGDYRRASQFYEQLVTSGKAKPEELLRYKLGLADSLRRLGENDQALAMFEQLTRENPTNLDAQEGRGLTLMALGKTVDAGRAFAEIMEKDGSRWRTLNALAILFVTKNMTPEAMAYYTEALKQSPDNPAILNNVGLSQAADRNFRRAVEALQQASRLAKTPSQRKQIDLNLAMVYGVSGDSETAKEVASKYIDGAALDNNLGLYAHLAKDNALAKTYLNMALSQSPTFYERAWNNLDAINDSGHLQGQTPPANALPVYK
jgi:Flp pilus assembly protein TadD